MTNTFDELKNYCFEQNNCGALLLTGQWGSGKSYYVENEFMNNGEMDAFQFMRISLFGITSVEALENAVRKAYKDALLFDGNRETSNVFKVICENIEKFKDLFKNDKVKTATTALLSLDISDFIPINDSINNKRAVLIFDDFERCSVQMQALVGCINNYCENKGIKVILIADEEKIRERNDDYHVLKEKLVSRTIAFHNDYETIISSIISNYKGNEKYQVFLKNNQMRVANWFVNNPIKNLRCLKSAINDFERLFQLYIKESFTDDLNQDLIVFIGSILKNRKGETEDDNASSKAKKNNVDLLFQSVENWIESGEYDECQIINEIQQEKRRRAPLPSKEVIKLNDLEDISEKNMNDGYAGFLEEAYGGQLTLNEYVHYLKNLLSARNIGYTFPEKLDYQKLKEGVQTHIDSLKIFPGDESETIERILGPDLLNDEEKEIYKIISLFRDGADAQFRYNKQLFIEAYSSGNKDLIDNVVIQPQKQFDEAMADAFAKYYNQLNDSRARKQAASKFFRFWYNMIESPVMCEEMLKGCAFLYSKIKRLDYKPEDCVIESFLRELEIQMDQLRKKAAGQE